MWIFFKPRDIEGKYLNKTDNIEVEQLLNPSVATNNTEKVAEKRTYDNMEDFEHVTSKAFQRVHVSFQYTSSCNISTNNELNSCKISDMIRSRENFDNRRNWLIEMN